MLSVIIICRNEEVTLERCLKSVKWAKEIIVLDSGSTDNSVAIAKHIGAKVMVTDWPGFGIQKQRALALATQEWVLSLDADEFLPQTTQIQVQDLIQNTKDDAFILPIQMIFQNKILKYSGLSRHIRLFRREKARFSEDAVHEKVILQPDARISSPPLTILHESYQDWEDAITKMNLYSTLSAKSKSGSSNIGKALLASMWMLIRNLFFKAWILDGGLGVALAMYQAQGSWYRYLKHIMEGSKRGKV